MISYRVLLCVCSLPLTVAVFVGPTDTSVQQGGTATLGCSNGDFVSGVRIWREGTTTFANQDGIFTGDTFTKYQDFQINSPTSTQLDLIIPSAQVAHEGTYTCELTPGLGSAVFTVEIQGSTPIITVDGDSSGNPIILAEDVETTLRCTATGYRPAVNLEWYMNNEKITTGVSEDSPISSGDTFETSGTLTMTPTKDDNEASLECRTKGQQVVSEQIGSLALNVQFKPRVTVKYEFSTTTILCLADANPVTNIQYVIFLNDTAQTPGSSLPFNNADYGCTRVRCDVTNIIGTGTGNLPEDICPDPVATTPGVTTSITSRTTVPNTCSCVCASTGVGAIIGALLGGIVIGAVAVIVIVVLMRRHRDRSTQRPDKAIIDGDEGHYEMSTEPPRNRQIPLAGSSVNKTNQPDGPMNKMTKPAVYESISENKMAVGSEAPKDATYGNVGPELSFSRDLIVIENEIGRGAFGRVLLGTAQGIMGDGNLTKVAIKTLKDGADGQAKTGLLQELDLMKKVGSHPHVVNLLGYCVEKDPIYVIVEYLSKGDLKNVLIGCRSEDTGTGYFNIHGISKSLSKTLIKFARDVASGMAFLSSQKCIHRDLAARNVLVSEDMVCKVADFGLARDVMNVRIYQRESEGVLPMRWMALESLLDDVYTTESDVWSFGILLWEIVTLGARPYRLMTAKTMVAQLREGYRMPKPRHCREELYSMMSSCWLQNPNKRPTFRSLFKQLEKSLTNEADYIKLGDLDENIYEVTKIGDDNEKL
ncbi:uncharacterized protein [Asterias amurensis]|uniref:uncharacterized protein n=1 Tax=Asterias amurensis TaxID=7602 RepID=UPI003AB23437